MWVCVCDANGAKAQSHSPSSQVGKQLSGLWLLAEQTSLFLMLCFLKVQGYQPTSHLCAVYLPICSRVDGPVFSLRGVGITCAFQLAVFRRVLFCHISCYRNRIVFKMCFNMSYFTIHAYVWFIHSRSYLRSSTFNEKDNILTDTQFEDTLNWSNAAVKTFITNYSAKYFTF